jgi:hypothetical protein
MAANNKIQIEQVTEALSTIYDFCNTRKHICEDCPLANLNDECLVYEYPYLWNVKPKTVVKIMHDK